MNAGLLLQLAPYAELKSIGPIALLRVMSLTLFSLLQLFTNDQLVGSLVMSLVAASFLWPIDRHARPGMKSEELNTWTVFDMVFGLLFVSFAAATYLNINAFACVFLVILNVVALYGIVLSAWLILRPASQLDDTDV